VVILQIHHGANLSLALVRFLSLSLLKAKKKKINYVAKDETYGSLVA